MAGPKPGREYVPVPGTPEDPTGIGNWRAVAVGVDKGYSDDPRNKYSPRELAEARLRARPAVLGEWSRLGLDDPDSGVDTAEQALYGHAPGYGPEMAANQLESKFGSLEQRPGWRNAKQFAEAGAKDAAEDKFGRTSAGAAMDILRRNQFLLSPERLEYMQQGPGRAVDLLRNLRDDPVEAMRYWDKSLSAKREREDFDDPNYQRFSGGLNGMQAWMLSPTSPLSAYVRLQKVIPDSIAFAASEPDDFASDSVGKAGNIRAFQDRVRLAGSSPVQLPDGSIRIADSHTPILDLPDNATASDYATRRRQLESMWQDMQPPADQNAINPTWRTAFGSDAPAAAVDLWSLLRTTADATLPGGLLFGIRSHIQNAPAHWAKQSARRLAAGLPIRPYRPLGLVGASLIEGRQQMVPELAFEAGARHVSDANSDRSWGDWLTRPVPSEELDPLRREWQHSRFEEMQGRAPQSIWNEREKAFRKHVVSKSSYDF